jgi:cyclopropane fatty-acyl-phospholipid synthase-like methyltransferase
MSLGLLTRKLLGPHLFKYAGKFYRNIFVDLRKFYQCLPKMKPNQCILDIGGGDGELINYILKDNPLVKITMIDVASSIGNSINPQFKNKICFLPNTSISYYKKHYINNAAIVDYILISDVIHHIEPSEREEFFTNLKEIIGITTIVAIKDVEPGYFKSWVAYLADKYISGDRLVKFINKKEVISYMMDIFPDIHYYETNLFKINRPNYCLIFQKETE